MKTPKKTRKQHNYGECNVIYDRQTGADWIGCSVGVRWFHVEGTSLKNDVYIEMAGFDVSIWLCTVCLPNLVMYLLVSSSVVALVAMKEGLKTLCEKVDVIVIAGREADARHFASLSLLQAKISEIAERSKRQIALVMVSMGS
jgi:hypothetical protein